ncbi:MAG TPA: DUF481 domain-containing protein [Gemmatimonadaceae bacterium]
MRRQLAFLLPLWAVPVFAQGPSRTSFTADVGYVSSSGNTRFSTASLGDRIVKSRDAWTFTQVARYVYGQLSGNETASELQLQGRVDYAFTEHFGVFGGVEDGRNTFAGFRARTNEFTGVAWKAIETHTDSLNFDAGGEYTQETDDNRAKIHYPAARLATSYQHEFSSTASFLQTVEFVPDLRADAGRRANSETTVVAPVSTHVAIKIYYTIRYENRPPIGFGTTDRLLTMGLQFEF